ncbi:MAG TPA: biopolymer transporter ExbD [Bacteroidales bacterium]|jgi:biopolymer transport protein ExbD|nr:biopolymer transporter ExbD [Bacteroidales bacterium]HOL97869.1 biopolymer transporter ExbD [Bacteroidales bacterium]HOM35614.1 biopolymer transporter ExbD [Bacteroidales bacterium]HPD22825.1 biopolymer transporter ExbD [Bacteroidales bacterium]HRS98912.1 biopolymer transporter ExbD [Bacteroidales bacterium]
MAKREISEINAGSMADIAFLLLIFFLVTTTMDVDTGIARQLPPIPEDKAKTEAEINRRNIFIVLINAQDRLLVNGKPMNVEELKDKAKEFIKSDPNNPELPTMVETKIDGIPNPVLVSEGVISLQNDRGTTYKKYMEVQNELVKAYNELRDEAALQYFGKRRFEDLTEAEQEAVKKIYPQRISEAEPKNIGGKK